MDEQAAHAPAEARAAADGAGTPGPAVAAALLVALAAAFALVGAYAPTEVPSYTDSPRAIIGMALMLTLLPPYVMLGVWVAQRRSLTLVEQTRPLLDDPRAADEARATVRSAFRRTRLRFALLGIVMGLLNTQPLAAARGELPVLELTISMGQIVMWITIGTMAGVRFGSAQAFRRLSEIVPLDLFRLDRLKPIARAGVIDVVLIMGAFLLAPLQSLDLEFRWYNYQFALLVGLPAATFAVLWPLVPLHRRNRAQRDARLAEIDRQVARLDASAATPADADASVRLEALLAHRDRLRGVRTWPLGTALLSRVLLYIVIPPLAWAGAAVVERLVDRLLGG
jgi:hypothetical protein